MDTKEYRHLLQDLLARHAGFYFERKMHVWLVHELQRLICRMKAKDALRKPSQGIQNQLHLLFFPVTLGRRILETVGNSADIIPLSSW